MADDPKLTVSETDLALISFARALIDVLQAADVVPPEEIDRAIKPYEDLMTQAGYAIAAGILGSIREFSKDPDRERSLKNLRWLIKARPQGTA